MWPRRNSLCASVLIALVVGATTGCAPRITSFDPNPGQRLTAVTVKGVNVELASIDFEGHMIGSWFDVVAGGRTTIVPMGPVPPVLAPVKACNFWSCSPVTTLPLVLPVAPVMPVNINIVSGSNATDCNYFGAPAQCVTVAGTGIYPGNASVAHPGEGPSAKTTGGTGGDTALGTLMITGNTLVVYFPKTLGPGPFKIEITNLGAFGGLSGSTFLSFVP